MKSESIFLKSNIENCFVYTSNKTVSSVLSNPNDWYARLPNLFNRNSYWMYKGSSANYQKAVEILKERYGSKQILVSS